jgi:polyisoprenoid-binding protein YceI
VDSDSQNLHRNRAFLGRRRAYTFDVRAACLAWICSLLLAAAIVSYRIQPAPGSFLELEVYKTGLWNGRKHVFSFQGYSGQIQYDPAQPENSRAHLVIEAKSAVCKDEWVKPADQKKVQAYALDDMMAAGKYPEIIFDSTRITAKGNGRYEAVGNLTLRGITKPVTIDLTVNKPNDSLELSGTAQIRLKDYGLKPPSAALGTIGTKNVMLLRFKIVATR